MDLWAALLTGSFTLLGLSAGLWIQHRNFEQEWKNQFRLAALDKRLEVHQEAYRLFRTLVRIARRPDEADPVVQECQRFWEDSCLYLDPMSRKEFQWAFQTVAQYGAVVHDDGQVETWKRLMAVGRWLAEGVALPSIGETMEMEAPPKRKTKD